MIWLIGSKGMLGREVGELLDAKGLYWIGSGHEVDITSMKQIENFITHTETSYYLDSHEKFSDPTERKIKWIINCAAYTAVDKAEEKGEKEKVIATNEQGVLNIARVARSHGSRLIHISTDYVFDGKSRTPYKETDAKNPINFYGMSKSKGEDAITSSMSQYYILRTSWLYGFYGRNFVYTIMNLLNTKDEINVVSDQWGTPTFCDSLASVIVMIIEKSLRATSVIGRNSAPSYGIYHFTDGGKTTWCEFAKKISEECEKLGIITRKCKINEVSTSEYKTAATRPLYSVLDKSKIEHELHLKLPAWDAALRNFLMDRRLKRN